MLLGELYTINDLQIGENNTIHAKIDLNVEHKIFDGHFPAQAVMPGVCMVQLLTDAISLVKQKEHRLLSAEVVKFIRLILPSEVHSFFVTLKILSETEEAIKAEASIFLETTTFLKFKGSFCLKNI